MINTFKNFKIVLELPISTLPYGHKKYEVSLL